MDLGVMIEGQEGLNWDLWRRIARTTEDLGFESLWRSDHFFSLTGPRDRDALETFVSFVLVAQETRRVRFGPLVASMTFRHPSLLARMAAQIDALSGGRFILGVGAGWNVPEHEAFGIDFPAVRERMDRLDEGCRVIRALWGQGPASYEGRYYRLKDVDMHPKPAQRPAPLLVGGTGERRTLRIVAEHADEWNATGQTRDGYLAKRVILERHCADAGRDPSTIRHSLMGGFVVGKDERAMRAHLGRMAERNPMLGRGTPDEVLAAVRQRGWYVGTPGEIVETMGRLEEAGVTRIMLQHHAMDDFDTLELLAADVLPQVQRS
jgi:F420-dependent oxidoreductase-like protein